MEMAEESEMKKVFLARVFHRESMQGNLTGVVVCPEPPSPGDCRYIARRLGFPDTCFVWRGESGNWIHRTFSPFEELCFCTQTLLAGAATLQEMAGPGGCSFETAVGAAVVHRDEGLYWIRQEVEAARPLEDRSVLSRLGLGEGLLAGEPAVTGGARPRLYIPLPSPDALYRLTLSPETVLKICREQGLKGLCFFAVVDGGLIALRVFTTSLGGGEDAATGGAALGLIGYHRFRSLGLSGRVRVEQGQAETEKRGCLRLRWSPASPSVWLGSPVDVLVRGTLVGSD